jgi:hypothetical protein
MSSIKRVDPCTGAAAVELRRLPWPARPWDRLAQGSPARSRSDDFCWRPVQVALAARSPVAGHLSSEWPAAPKSEGLVPDRSPALGQLGASVFVRRLDSQHEEGVATPSGRYRQIKWQSRCLRNLRFWERLFGVEPIPPPGVGDQSKSVSGSPGRRVP